MYFHPNNLKSEKNKPWLKPWFIILYCTSSIHCRCQNIKSVFRVLKIYNFGFGWCQVGAMDSASLLDGGWCGVFFWIPIPSIFNPLFWGNRDPILLLPKKWYLVGARLELWILTTYIVWWLVLHLLFIHTHLNFWYLI